MSFKWFFVAVACAYRLEMVMRKKTNQKHPLGKIVYGAFLLNERAEMQSTWDKMKI